MEGILDEFDLLAKLSLTRKYCQSRRPVVRRLMLRID